MPLESSPTEATVDTFVPGMVSVLVPVYNEAESIGSLHVELVETLTSSGRPFEIIYVDDGSTDVGLCQLKQLASSDPRVVLVEFRRNFGQTAAMTAGIDFSRGEYLVPIDADLQNDPADIPKLIEKLESGYDVVSGWRRRRQDRALTRILPSRLANALISWITGVKLHDYGCTLKAYRREVIEGVRLYGEMHRFVPVFASLHGGKVAEMEVNHRPRRFGKSKYGLERTMKVLLDLMLVKFLASYSSKPIYVFGGFGILCLLLSLAPIGLAIYFKVTPIESMQKDFVETPLPVIASVLIIAGFLGILQGLLAEVLMRTYFESQGKRPYLIRRVTRSA